MTYQAVARVDELAPGATMPVVIDDIEMLLGRDGERYFATQRRCPHRGGDLNEGIISRGHLICPNHGWRFSTATGCLADASEYCLLTYPVRVVDGRIEIDSVPTERIP